MKYVTMLFPDRTGFSNVMAEDFVGKITDFIDEKQTVHKGKVVKSRYVSGEGIYITLELPDKASIESMQSLLGVSLN